MRVCVLSQGLVWLVCVWGVSGVFVRNLLNSTMGVRGGFLQICVDGLLAWTVQKSFRLRHGVCVCECVYVIYLRLCVQMPASLCTYVSVFLCVGV